MRSDRYQIALIVLGVVATAGMGVFFYRELFPEYRIYQNDYVALEKFRSSYTGEPPPAFKEGVKQIVIEREDKGPAVIDRCTSCHVALQFPHFSPTKIARGLNGDILYDAQGVPVQVPNDQYVWAKLDARISELQDEKVNEQLKANGEGRKVAGRLSEAAYLASLKSVEVDGHTYEMSKVLSMHPLMGSETRPFEYHPIETYGCTSCHNGNGRGLTTEKAHGPVFDGQYEAEFVGYVPQFLEKDPNNDPQFSRIFNGKPGHDLLFQTSPIYVGALIQSKCMQCHVTAASSLENAAFATAALIQNRQKRDDTVQAALQKEKQALLDTLALKQLLAAQGIDAAIQELDKRAHNFAQPAEAREDASTQLAFLQKIKKGRSADQASAQAFAQLQAEAVRDLGSERLAAALQETLSGSKAPDAALDKFLSQSSKDKDATGSLFAKMAALQLSEAVAAHVKDVETSFAKAAGDEKTIAAIASEIDLLTYNYHRGEELFISQACYACHRIAGFSRGGVGPELTQEGKAYPWYVKQKITWPQSDLKTSTMPNMKIDHEELEDLVTFVLGQMGESKAISATEYRTAVQQWEAGRKMAWERPITPAEMLDLRFSMTVFATQGCAACHRLKGFESNVGFAVEKGKDDKTPFDTLYPEKVWFQQLFPEDISGTQIVRTIEEHAAEIDQRIVSDVRKGAILEEIERDQPRVIEAFYTPFKYAARAKNTDLKDNPVLLQAWKDRVHRVLMMFVQEYGLGRLIGPRPNWTGVYRSDEWLMEHFRNPAGHVPRSIMPVLPFDDTKFYSLTHLLDVMGIRNRDEVHAIWEHRGFSPEQAFHIHCAQCHGDYKQGNGPVAEWIYPIPKNLSDSTFLRNLTKEKAIYSITHGVHGTPMPPWGEAAAKPGVDGVPVLTEEEIGKLVEWMYSFLPGESNLRGDEGILKWQYTPQNAIDELRKEGNKLESKGAHSTLESKRGPAMAVLVPHNELFAERAPVSRVSSSGDVSAYFDVIDNPVQGGEKELYFIKKQYYTPENIEQGKAFFEMNCAVCHGKEADGAGLRAEAMHDAKPRMLTNLDWIDSHDDLRLLRSIKYGVPGTGMTPWGDFTSSLQRMQLVIFIRSLSTQTELRNKLSEAIYRAFDVADFRIEQARAAYYPQLAALEEQLDVVQRKRKSLYAQASDGEAPPKDAVDAYNQELQLLTEIGKLKAADKLYLTLKSNVKKEKDLFDTMGKSLIQNGGEGVPLDDFLQALALLDGSFTYETGQLSFRFDKAKAAKLTSLATALEGNLQQQIDKLAQGKKAVEGKIGSPERTRELAEINAQISALTKLKNTLTAGFDESLRLREQQGDVVRQLKEQAKGEPTKTLSKEQVNKL